MAIGRDELGKEPNAAPVFDAHDAADGTLPGCHHTPTTTSLLRKALFAGLIVLAFLALTELGLRAGHRLVRGSWDFMPAARVLGQLYVPHPYIGYTLTPNKDFRIKDSEIHTNRWAFRGPDIEQRKPRGVTRIVCLGGSTTFSLFASNNDHTWPAQLERVLNERYGAGRFEVLNFGTPGYCAIESFLTLSLKAIDFDPDIVLIHHGWNDIAAVFRPDVKSDYTHFRGFYSKVAGTWLSQLAIGRLLMANFPHFARLPYEGSQYFSPEGLGIFKQHLESIIHLAQGRGAVPVVITPADALPQDPAMWTRASPVTKCLRTMIAAERQVARRLGVPLIDLAADFPKDTRFFADDYGHKSDEGLRLTAQMVADELERLAVFSGTRVARSE